MRRENYAATIGLNPQAVEKLQKFTAQFKAQNSQAEAGITQALSETNKTEAASTKWIIQLSNIQVTTEQTLSSELSNSQQIRAKYHLSYLSERGLLG